MLGKTSKCWENVGKVLGKCWENVGKMLGKWENGRMRMILIVFLHLPSEMAFFLTGIGKQSHSFLHVSGRWVSIL